MAFKTYSSLNTTEQVFIMEDEEKQGQFSNERRCHKIPSSLYLYMMSSNVLERVFHVVCWL